MNAKVVRVLSHDTVKSIPRSLQSFPSQYRSSKYTNN